MQKSKFLLERLEDTREM